MVREVCMKQRSPGTLTAGIVSGVWLWAMQLQEKECTAFPQLGLGKHVALSID